MHRWTCRCYQELKLIFCTGVGLNSMPLPTSSLDSYASILLRDNYLQHLNFSSLFEELPLIVRLDLLDNNSLLCQISYDFDHANQSRSFLIVSIQQTWFQTILLQLFWPPIKQRVIHRHLTPNQASQEIPGKSQECKLQIRNWNFVYLSADCKSGNSTNNNM